MNLSKLVLSAILMILFCQCKVFQYEDTPRVRSRNNVKPIDGDGKCYAKCLIADITELQSEEYAIYTGDESAESVDIEVKKIIVQKGSSKWVKKKVDRNCGSPNPDDCLVWCLEEQPDEIEEIKILTDTTQSKNYEIRKIDTEVMIEKGGFTDWRPVLCGNDLTDLIIDQIQNSLRENNYYNGENTRLIDAKTKASLTRFQKDKNLPIGHLDFETLDMLGIVVD